jgi:hypothetical protein
MKKFIQILVESDSCSSVSELVFKIGDTLNVSEHAVYEELIKIRRSLLKYLPAETSFVKRCVNAYKHKMLIETNATLDRNEVELRRLNRQKEALSLKEFKSLFMHEKNVLSRQERISANSKN